MNPDVLLTIAGTDSGGAAGVAADLATFAGLGAHGCCVVTAVTAQDTTGVHAVHPVPPEIVARQLDAVLDDLPVVAVKTGMLGDAEVVRLVARRLGGGERPLVVDPVLVATSGAVLGDAAVVGAYVEHLLPAAGVVTPNADEARTLLGAAPGACPREMAAALALLGPRVVLTGGPAPSDVRGAAPGTCTDWVACPGEDPVALTHPAVPTGNDHGTGCTFSAALAVHLGRDMTLLPAARRAAAYTAHQLRISRGWTLGRGRGPVAHVGAHLAAHSQETR